MTHWLRALDRHWTLILTPITVQVTLLTFLWPGRLRGRRLICFCTLLLDAPAWCLPSSELSVLSLLSPLPWCPAWVTGNIVTLSPDSAHSLTAPASPGLPRPLCVLSLGGRSPPGSWLQHSAHFGNLTHSLVTLNPLFSPMSALLMASSLSSPVSAVISLHSADLQRPYVLLSRLSPLL